MKKKRYVKLGVNIDHVATLREARRGSEPRVLTAAFHAVRGGARGITVHLREDRRHIQDHDVFELHERIRVPLNLEMSIASEIVKVAIRVKPEKACLVPEKRKELTTEGGLDVAGQKSTIGRVVKTLQSRGVLVSLFIDPIEKQIRAASEVGSDYIELHTGTYANAKGKRRKRELLRLQRGAGLAHSLGLGVNAGHGLDYENVKLIARIPNMIELNIGHAIVARAISVGLERAVREMVKLI